ncbi:lipase chaperone, partial [Pseudomonas sp. OA3]|nr:lipase chaperone [Pseudomonas sp. OA3]
MSRFVGLSLVAVVLVGGFTLYWRWPAAVPEVQPAATVAVPSRQSSIEQV